MLGRQTPLNFHTFLESPVHTEDLVSNTAPLQAHQTNRQEYPTVFKQRKPFIRWFRSLKPIHGPIAGMFTGGFFIILGIVLVLIRWIANNYQRVDIEDMYGPILLIVAGGGCAIAGFIIGLMGDRVYEDTLESPELRQEPVRAIKRRVETVMLRTRMDEHEVARREMREARYKKRRNSDDSRRSSGVIIQVTQPSPPYQLRRKNEDSNDRRHSLQSWASQDESDEQSRSDPGRLCPDKGVGSPILVKEIPSSRRMSLHGDMEVQEDLSLGLGEVIEDNGCDSDSVRDIQAGDSRRGSLSNWSRAKGALVNRSFEMD